MEGRRDRGNFAHALFRGLVSPILTGKPSRILVSRVLFADWFCLSAENNRLSVDFFFLSAGIYLLSVVFFLLSAEFPGLSVFRGASYLELTFSADWFCLSAENHRLSADFSFYPRESIFYPWVFFFYPRNFPVYPYFAGLRTCTWNQLFQRTQYTKKVRG